MLSTLVLVSGLAASASAHITQHHHKRSSPQALYKRAGGAIPADGYQAHRDAPNKWAYEQLEPYEQYNFRYLGVNCHKMHNTDFFERCCHPRYAGKTDDDYAYECSLIAHSDAKPKQLKVEMKAAGAAASSARSETIASISSVSYESAHPEPTHTKSKKPKPEPTSVKVEVTSKAPEPTSTEIKTKTHVKPSKEPETSKEVETSKEEPAPTTTSEDEQPTHAAGGGHGGGGGGGGEQYGARFGTPSIATWYLQAGTIGACGLQSSPVSDQTKVAAMRYDFYDASKCGQNVKVTNTANGKSVIAMFNDMCMGCETETSVDLSPGAFEEIGSFLEGTVDIEWEWA